MIVKKEEQLLKIVVFRQCRISHPKVFCKKDVLKNSAKFTRKHLFQNLVFNKVACHSKETLAQVFSCKFGKILKNTFFIEHLRVTASGN